MDNLDGVGIVVVGQDSDGRTVVRKDHSVKSPPKPERSRFAVADRKTALNSWILLDYYRSQTSVDVEDDSVGDHFG